MFAEQCLKRSSDTTPRRFVTLEGGQSWVGTHRQLFREDGEGPPRKVRIKPFRIDPHTVTVRWFTEFVEQTGYLTDAEHYGWSLVFHSFVADAQNYRRVIETPWWLQVESADWKHPFGPASAIEGLEDHPVTHVSWNDARAFAAWAGGRLPSEAEWEYAARGGSPGATYPWGEAEPDDELVLCNIWQGDFPRHNTAKDGFAGTAPVRSFSPNGYGLYNMSGNVWEWCADLFRVRSLTSSAKRRNAAAVTANQRVMKGGSFLCHRSYCHRYRISARTAASADSSTSHVGFRIVVDH
ncbi:formylglycine-generating enzyme family protein [Nitratireductor basaltis]|uniref:formylglycine-generating enzyme family protein n=1 Tax=Nitratireductor basaltis TaxID=472175 RepID=UPI001FCAC7AE|nr:formylglycine-generating enzyme family protein [Nitratireductor basaltis]